MRLPLVQSVSQTDIYVSGDVTLHEKVVVASGVILQAAPNRRIMIEEGVCLGMGVVISASEGDILIVSGAILGAGVLVVGSGKIGQNACIGASSTLINVSVDPMAIIPSGSLVGDNSRQVAISPVAEFSEIPPRVNGHQTTEIEDFWQEKPPEVIQEEITSPIEPEVEISGEVELTPKPINKPEISQPVVGQVYINQLLVKLFPEREAFKKNL
jgi:carbon dioxide concentrating mechanism protein CcmN